jgi:hypothetical protein
MSKIKGGVELPYEIADKITLASMQDHRKMLKKQLNDHAKKGTWMHESDVAMNTKLVNCFDELIKYYGG